MRLRNSFWAMLGRDESEAPEAVLERVREEIFEALEPYRLDPVTRIENRVLFARDIEGLWYLRPEIMNAIAASHGEAAARKCLSQITALFQGHHPGAKPSRLGLR
jgi:hypothetical protein